MGCITYIQESYAFKLEGFFFFNEARGGFIYILICIISQYDDFEYLFTLAAVPLMKLVVFSPARRTAMLRVWFWFSLVSYRSFTSLKICCCFFFFSQCNTYPANTSSLSTLFPFFFDEKLQKPWPTGNLKNVDKGSSTGRTQSGSGCGSVSEEWIDHSNK